MASGNDPPQLPRGLIGRRGTPNAKGARLPSIRGPRDLTLGGVQKKVFVPNIPARRKQAERMDLYWSWVPGLPRKLYWPVRVISWDGLKVKVFCKADNAIPADQPSTSKGDSKTSDDGKGRGQGRGRGGTDRGRGRGDRGRRREMNVIQTHSLFEQGPGGEKMIRKSNPEYIQSGGARGSSSGARSAPKISIKTERTDEETKEVLDMLLKDDFVDIKGDPEEDVTLQPVKLPIEIKSESTVKTESTDYTKVKIKSEPGETIRDEKPDVSERKPDVMINTPKTDEISCAELFTKNVNSDAGILMFLQLPDTLPGLPLTTDDDYRGKKAEKKEPDKEGELTNKLKGCNLDNFSEGLVGKLVVRKSGRVQLQLGNTYLDVNIGTPCGFLQDLVSVRTKGDSGEATILGHIEHKLVCTPDFEMLLDST